MKVQSLTAITVPQATTMIWLAFLAGLASVAFTLWAVWSGVLGASVWNLIDVAIILTLSLGVLRRSYLCAWLLLAYHLTNRVLLYFTTGHVPGRLAFSISVLYLLGILGITALGQQPQRSRSSRTVG